MAHPLTADIRVSLIGSSAQVEAAFPGSAAGELEHLGYTFQTVIRDTNAYKFHFFTASTDSPISCYIRQKLSRSQLFIFLANSETGNLLASLLKSDSENMHKKPVIIVASPQEEADVRASEGYAWCCDNGMIINVVSRDLFDESSIDLILSFALQHIGDIKYTELK